MKVHIRWAIKCDRPQMLAIENSSYEFPWSEDDFLRRLRQRNCIGMVAETWVEGTGDTVVGFVIYELHKSRLHILNLAVHPDYRGLGVGRQIIEKLSKKLTTQRRDRLLLEVRDSNLGAQLFLRACGFRAVSILRDFYADTDDAGTGEDAYLMEYRLQVESETETRIGGGLLLD